MADVTLHYATPDDVAALAAQVDALKSTVSTLALRVTTLESEVSQPDTTAPIVTMALVADTGSSASDEITSNPAIKGTGDPNTAVTIMEGSTRLGSTTSDANGAWGITLSGIVDGQHTFTASQTDAAGNTGTATLTFSLDTTGPVISVALTVDDGTSSTDAVTSNPAVHGTADPNAAVSISEGATTLGTATADASGNWSFSPTGLTDGQHTLTASQTDVAGNTNMVSLTFTLQTAAPATTPLTATLTFSDGKTITASEIDAVDVGTFSDGGTVNQRCLRFRPTGNGDYRDAVMLDFRPEVDGSKGEVVFWYGCFQDFTDDKSMPVGPATPTDLFVPQPPVVARTATGTGAVWGTQINVVLTNAWNDGESCGSMYSRPAGTSFNVDDTITVTSPPATGGANGYHVYAGPSGDTYGKKLTGTPVPFGTNFAFKPSDITAAAVVRPPTKNQHDIVSVVVSGGAFASPVTVTSKSWWFGSKFRVQSARRPVLFTAADMVAKKLYMPIAGSGDGKWGSVVPPVSPWTGPMGIGGVNVGMAGTGERPDIGHIDNWFAAWLATGDAGALETCYANAEGVGSWPIHVNDIATGRPLSHYEHHNSVWDMNQYAWYRIKSSGGPNGSSAEYVRYVDTHNPNPAAEMYHITHDPYFLENAQTTANYSLCRTAYYNQAPAGETAPNLPAPLWGLVDLAEQRGVAWGLRDVFHADIATPDVVPSWLLPKSHWDASMADNKAFFDRFVASTDPYIKTFGSWAATGGYHNFEADFLNHVVSIIVWHGAHPGWDTILGYISTMRMAMTDPNPGGWDWRYPTPYYQNIQSARLGAASPEFPTGVRYLRQATTNTPVDVNELWAGYQGDPTKGVQGEFAGGTGALRVPNWTAPSTWTPDRLHVEFGNAYYAECISALAHLANAGIAGAADRFTHMTTKMKEIASPTRWDASVQMKFTYCTELL